MTHHGLSNSMIIYKAHFSILLAALLMATELWGQNVQVLSLEEDITCLTASEHEVFDANKEPCALLKIRVVDNSVAFKSDWLIRTEAKGGSEHWVWLCGGTRDITITSDHFLPYTVVFNEHSTRINGLKGRHTYELTLAVQQATAQAGIEVTLSCNVQGASFKIDGFPLSAATAHVDGGKHRVTATADGYDPYEGEIDVNPYQGAQHFDLTMRAAIASAKEQVKEGNRLVDAEQYADAVKWYLKAVRQGSADAQYQLGMLYFRGWGVVQDFEEAHYYFSLASDQGHADATCALAELYWDGYGVDKDQETTNRLFDRAIALGSTRAMAHRGYLYAKNGETKRGEDLVDKAAKKGEAKAIFIKGIWIYSRDCKNALKYWQKAADMGDEQAMAMVGWMYWRGNCVGRNGSLATKWYKQAERYNNPSNYVLIGDFYRDNLLYDHAISYYKRAVEVNKTDAMVRLRDIYKGQNDRAYYYWLRRAAQAGHARSCFLMGEEYRVGGRTYEKNADSSALYYRMAAERGGGGDGVNTDGKGMLESGSFYRGDAACDYQLGVLYENPNWKDHDIEIAIRRYRAAVRKGKHQGAIEALRRLGVPLTE